MCGYLTGSGLAAYNETGEIAGVKLPAGLVDGSCAWTPDFHSIGKAEVGEHDELVTREELYAEVGQPGGSKRLEELSLSLYTTAEKIAREQGIILADTKMEFGTDSYRGEITLGDEVLTPDSSRFWMRPSTSGPVQPASISGMCVTGCVPGARLGRFG